MKDTIKTLPINVRNRRWMERAYTEEKCTRLSYTDLFYERVRGAETRAEAVRCEIGKREIEKITQRCCAINHDISAVGCHTRTPVLEFFRQKFFSNDDATFYYTTFRAY